MIDISCEEILNTNGFIISGFRGTSMTPLLRADRDKVYIEKITKRLKKGDIALYKRSNGERINWQKEFYKLLKQGVKYE